MTQIDRTALRPIPALANPAVPSASAPGAGAARAAQGFEAMAIGEFLQPMFSTVDTDGDPFDGGQAEGILKPMLVSEFAKLMEAKGGLGLTPIIEQKMAELTRAKATAR